MNYMKLDQAQKHLQNYINYQTDNYVENTNYFVDKYQHKNKQLEGKSKEAKQTYQGVKTKVAQLQEILKMEDQLISHLKGYEGLNREDIMEIRNIYVRLLEKYKQDGEDTEEKYNQQFLQDQEKSQKDEKKDRGLKIIDLPSSSELTEQHFDPFQTEKKSLLQNLSKVSYCKFCLQFFEGFSAIFSMAVLAYLIVF